MGIFGTQKMLSTLFGGRGSQKVYGLYTHENVDIYGQPLPVCLLTDLGFLYIREYSLIMDVCM